MPNQNIARNRARKNAQRIKKFLQLKGFKVSITRVSPRHAGYAEWHHVIEYDGKKGIKLLQLLQHVFAEIQTCAPDTYAVAITPDFIICRNCGCSDQHACADGCYWVEEDVCSACATPAQFKKMEGAFINDLLK